MLCGFTAASAGVGKMLLNEGDATGFYAARLLLDLFLARGLAAPHSLDISLFVLWCFFLRYFPPIATGKSISAKDCRN